MVVGAVLALWPGVARADLGIPVGAVFWPATWLLFLPVVVVEALVARRMLGLGFRAGFGLSLRANTWSTALGVPVACVVMIFVQLLQATGPGRNQWSKWVTDLLLGSTVMAGGMPNWTLFAGPALLCVPCFILSVAIETWSASKTVPRAAARRWARAANAITYGVFFAALVVGAVLTARSDYR